MDLGPSDSGAQGIVPAAPAVVTDLILSIVLLYCISTNHA